MRIRCPHCHHPIETIENDPLVEIDCPSCGSNFSLISGHTATRAGRMSRTIGHFQLLEVLGQGAFGSVWKARDAELDRIGAIKMPREQFLDEIERERFLREARAAAQLRHGESSVSTKSAEATGNCTSSVTS